MRGLSLVIVAAFLTVGCQSNSDPNCCPATAPSHALVTPQMFDDDVAAAALVFDAPTAADEMPLDLARGTRQPAAFVGYDQQTTTYSFVVTEDRQGNFNSNNGDHFWRRAFSARVGVSTR